MQTGTANGSDAAPAAVSDPALAEALMVHGSGALEQSAALYLSILKLQRDNIDALHLLGMVRSQQKRYGEALRYLTRALAAKAGDLTIWHNRGLVLGRMGRILDACEDLAHAVGLSGPNVTTALLNDYGAALCRTGRIAEADEVFARALAASPDNAVTQTNMALNHLLMGRFGEGWALYERRWQAISETTAELAFGLPQWDGRDTTDTVLLHCEQGFGDSIQFARYVPMVAQRVAKLILGVPPGLQRLFASLAGGATLLVDGDHVPPGVAQQCPLMGLPHAFATDLASVPAAVPYLGAPGAVVQAWHGRLRGLARPRVGIAWSGNPDHFGDAARSLPAAAMLAAIPTGWTIVNLQTAFRPGDEATLAADPRVLRFDADVRDFADTAALMGEVDLVLSADTSVAHLAGALGRPVWILVPFAPDWRWMLQRTDSPWYPTARLFRQIRPGDWRTPLAAVSAALAA